jgi:hypothetical protein
MILPRKTLAAAALLLVVAGCSHRRPSERDLYNVDAALPAALPLQPLNWQVITSTVDREHHTMATLFGNDVAVKAAHGSDGQVQYPAAAVLSEVTWLQREDEHWFGGRIPQRFVAMEVVRVAPSAEGRPAVTYERFGPSGQRTSESPGQDAAREQAILAERPSPMP